MQILNREPRRPYSNNFIYSLLGSFIDNHKLEVLLALYRQKELTANELFFNVLDLYLVHDTDEVLVFEKNLFGKSKVALTFFKGSDKAERDINLFSMITEKINLHRAYVKKKTTNDDRGAFETNNYRDHDGLVTKYQHNHDGSLNVVSEKYTKDGLLVSGIDIHSATGNCNIDKMEFNEFTQQWSGTENGTEYIRNKDGILIHAKFNDAGDAIGNKLKSFVVDYDGANRSIVLPDEHIVHTSQVSAPVLTTVTKYTYDFKDGRLVSYTYKTETEDPIRDATMKNKDLLVTIKYLD